ncbi:hypothetical protein DICPUDRAFT_93905 [Dictyostelium purpureum]|uniref:Phospholipid-transporting ATPase n=1 Tax=Dictyostelium purpureum TaxID=5786 RepID=F0ZD69_DICPU|nr:uncharacterized protein DICPUDRAFT_93905 [Dictyostelium purpureum]EGC38128.1 hypothetical protein DICPUDRAFT_93905 [Dictyostelium purpureum]|eukprot:XP_003285342.1 hypothetical protein DICPUDRAFT_93905 [Dictyostelium purpureum]
MKMRINLRRKKARPSYPIVEIRSSKTEDLNKNKGYKSNEISTTKYNRYNFLFKNLYEQFRRITNIYFLAICIITLIPQVSPLSPVTSILPLIFVLVVTAIKEAYEDFKRFQSDKDSNYREYKVYRDGEFRNIRSKDIEVGDYIKIEDNQPFPSDILVLTSTLEDGVCYVETSQLDGETNLKMFKAAKESYNLTEEQVLSLNANIECELPNNNLYKFKGKVTNNDDNTTFSVNEKQLMLRGAKLRNTPSIIGVVLYCGKDTKLSLNQKNPPSKFSKVEKRLGKSVIGIFCFKVLLVIIATVLASRFEWKTARESWYMWRVMDEAVEDTLGFIIVKNFVSYFAILSFLIPMSLMVTLEVVKISQAKFMEWDTRMSYKENKEYEIALMRGDEKELNDKDKDLGDVELSNLKSSMAMGGASIAHKYMSVKNSNLNDELALIKYIFSDKTGTLTENKMLFSKCSINGVMYDDALNGQLGNLIQSDKSPSENEAPIREFLLNMSLCHAAVSEVNDMSGDITYQSQSPDEIALCDCARNNQFTYVNRTTNQVQIRVFAQDKYYDLLAIMEFSSDRRRMSILLRDPESGKIILYSKGADSIMMERLSEEEKNSEILQKTKEHITDFSREGLRTLILAKREISQEEYDNWSQLYHDASTLIHDREVEIEKLNDQIERGFQLVGCTAIEDKLQEGVPEAIDYLLKAGIRIWIITGDKQETAINIGYSCKLLTPEIPIVIINATTTEECQRQIQQAIKNYITPMSSTEVPQEISMVIDGETLVFVLKDHSEDFLKIAAKCHSVVCCRVTPLQKALIVRLVKRATKEICLSIGDGANDVSMIQEAHIGVGIHGNEGSQAARASDYSLLRFRHLARLITVHGRYSMVRNTLCIKYSFYKNMAFFLCQFWFSIYSGWTSMTLYDSWIVTTFNILMTSIPPYFMALFEKDVNERVIPKYPKLYKEVQNCHLFSYRSIFSWLFGALYHSIVFFFGLYFFLNGDDIMNHWGKIGGKELAGSFVSTFGVLAILLKAAVEMKHWNFIVHLGIWCSMIVFLVISLVDSAILSEIPNMYGVYMTALALLKFYCMVIIMIFIALIPDFTIKFLRRHLSPSASNIAQEDYVLNYKNKNKKLLI